MSYWRRVRKDFWETFCSRYDAGENFTEDELNYMAFDCNQKDEIEGDSRRWTKSMTTIFECDGRFFSIDWDCGLTEIQENEFYNQPQEVELREYEKTITVKEWIPVESKQD